MTNSINHTFTKCGSQREIVTMFLDFYSYITEKTKHLTGREWVFEKVNSWLDDADGARVFLLTGGSGTGKSAVAARLAQMNLGLVDV